MKLSPRRVLVVGPSWVGDMVMAQSLFMVLQQLAPCIIDVLAPAWSLPILARMTEVNQGIVLATGHGQLGIGIRWRAARQLAANDYDQAIILPGSFKSALVPFFAGIGKRTAFRGEMRYGLINDMRPLDRQKLARTVQRFVALGLPSGAALPIALPRPHLQANEDNQAQLRKRLKLLPQRPAIAFMPGAEYGPAKQWPSLHFATVARQLLAQGKQVWVLGSARDRSVATTIVKACNYNPALLNLCGDTSLGDAVDLLAMCQAAVSNDSGLMHVAAALAIPLVAIYGSSTPAHTPPLCDKLVIRYLDLSCSPCFARSCPLGHTHCLHDIKPDSVLAALATLEQKHAKISLSPCRCNSD